MWLRFIFVACDPPISVADIRLRRDMGPYYKGSAGLVALRRELAEKGAGLGSGVWSEIS